MESIILNGNKASFEVNMIGDMTKQSFSGSFTCKCVLNPLEFIKADALYRELLGNTHPAMASSRAQDMSFALAQLKYRLVEFPPAWKSDEINGSTVDENILYQVLNMSFEAEKKYLGKTTERAKEMKEQLHNSIVNDEFVEELNAVDEDSLLKESMDNVTKALGELE